MSKVLHFVSLKCGRYNKRFDITNKTQDEIDDLIKKHLEPGRNFKKIIES